MEKDNKHYFKEGKGAGMKQLSIDDIQVHKRCKYCSFWHMDSLDQQSHLGYGISGTCSLHTGRQKGKIYSVDAHSRCPNFEAWQEEPEWRVSLFEKKDENGKLAQYQRRIADDFLDEEE